MFDTANVAAIAGVDPVTVRSWLCRAPDFHIGAIDGRANVYTATEALALLIAGEILAHGLARPHVALPAALAAAKASHGGNLFAYENPGGDLVIRPDAPDDVAAIVIPIAALRNRLAHAAPPRRRRRRRKSKPKDSSC